MNFGLGWEKIASMTIREAPSQKFAVALSLHAHACPLADKLIAQDKTEVHLRLSDPHLA